MNSVLFTILLALLAMVALVGFVALFYAIDRVCKGRISSFIIRLYEK